jgi:hypothetical protein
MRSAQDAAADALLDQVGRAVDNLALAWQPPVDLGFPAGGVQRDHVWVAGDVGDDEQTFAVSSLTAKDETFTLRVHVVCTRDTEDFTDARDDAKTVADAVEDRIHTYYTLGGVVQLAEVTGVETDEAVPSMSTRQVMKTLTVACRAWLT